eukprot:14414598-Ditylum_brightwellii.AAC.1
MKEGEDDREEDKEDGSGDIDKSQNDLKSFALFPLIILKEYKKDKQNLAIQDKLYKHIVNNTARN